MASLTEFLKFPIFGKADVFELYSDETKVTVFKELYIICFQPLNCHTGLGCVTSLLTPGQNDIDNNSDTVVIIVIIIMIESFRCQQFAFSSKGPIEYRLFQ